jgi:hypothetical protein
MLVVFWDRNFGDTVYGLTSNKLFLANPSGTRLMKTDLKLLQFKKVCA